MPRLTSVGLAERILRKEKKPLSPSEMWKLAVANGYDKETDLKGKTPASSFYTVIFLDTRDNPNTPFVKIGERPARYYLKELVDNTKDLEKSLPVADDTAPEIYDYSEADLHPFLAYFARSRFKAYAKTIRHSTSRKKEFGEWVHPDMIGVYYAVEDWKPPLLDLSTATGNMSVRLYSFELKKSLSFSNLREAFFQAVSNSSWAQEGYLVAADISDDEDFRVELRRLSASFGIGVIRIALDDPDSSEILFPARERENLDWDTLNKLTINKDVEDLLIRIRNDLQTKEVIREKYDPVLSTDDLVKRVSKKKQG
jgi:hypothetical protein